MRSRRTACPPNGNALRDATYRAIYRLEARKPNAAAGLCHALRAAWQARSSIEHSKEFAQWLDKVLPLGLELLADYLENQSSSNGHSERCGEHVRGWSRTARQK